MIIKKVWKEFLTNIFRKQVGTHFKQGLVDSLSEAAFGLALESVKEKWKVAMWLSLTLTFTLGLRSIKLKISFFQK